MVFCILNHSDDFINYGGFAGCRFFPQSLADDICLIGNPARKCLVHHRDFGGCESIMFIELAAVE